MGVMHPGLVMKNIIPVVMAGVLGIYGLIVAVIIQGSSKLHNWLFVCVWIFVNIRSVLAVTVPSADGATKYSSFTGYAHLSAGLCCGLRYVSTPD